MSRELTLLTQCFPPETHAGANRLASMASLLAQRFDLTVITIRPSYPNPEHFAGIDDPFEHCSPFRVIRTTPFHPHRGPTAIRGLRELWMAISLGRLAARHAGATVIASSPSLFVGLAGAVVALRARVPYVWDLRDLTWSYLGEGHRGFIGAKPASHLLAKLASWVARRASVVSVSNEGIAREVVRLGVNSKRIVMVPNGVSADLIDRGRQLPPLRGSGTPTVTYAGAIGHYQGLANLIEVAADLPTVLFNIIGDGPERAELIRKLERRGLSNVSIPGYLTREELFNVYAKSHILFAQLIDLPSMKNATVPTKVFEYMATGRPIVYAGGGLTAELLVSAGCALICVPGSPTSIAAGITELLDDPELMLQMGAAGKEAAPQFQRDVLLQPLLDAVEYLTSQGDYGPG